MHIWQIRRSPFFDVLMGDARGYDEWARRIAGGDWIGTDVFYQAPLYPYFLGVIYALAGHSLLAVRVVQAIIGAGSCVLARAGRRAACSRRGSASPPALVLALYAPAIFFDGLLQKSVLDVFFSVARALAVSRNLCDAPRPPARRGSSLGLAMGGLSLTRENALVLIAVIARAGALCARARPRRDVGSPTPRAFRPWPRHRPAAGRRPQLRRSAAGST